LDQAAFVMALLGPGIREENEHLIERAQRNLLEHLDSVVAHDAQIGQTLRLDRKQQPSHARAMNFDAEVVALRVCFGERGQVIPIAEADFHHARNASSKERIKIQRLRIESDPEFWPHLNERALLRRRQAAGARDVRTHGASVCGLSRLIHQQENQ
jgi:hypothetical protein